MLELVLKLVSLLAFVASLAVLAVYIPDLDLILVTAAVVLMAAYDFLVRPELARRRRRRS